MNDAATAVALTEMNGKLEQVLQGQQHQTEIMSRNREDASRDIQACQKDILQLEERTTLLEKLEEQRKGATRLLTVIVGITGTLLGLAISLATKLI